MGVRVERDGAVTTVVIDRPEVRNAVDGPTAAALADAFREFDGDENAHVAVLDRGGRDVLRRRGFEGRRRAGGQPGGARRRRTHGTQQDAAGQAGHRRD